MTPKQEHIILMNLDTALSTRPTPREERQLIMRAAASRATTFETILALSILCLVLVVASLPLGALVLFILATYFLPTIVAISRRHPNTLAIFLLNLFLGWTLLGWVGSLVWSAISLPTPPREPVIYIERR